MAQVLDWLQPARFRLSLRYGPQRRDRYGRLLAQAYLPDGRNLGALLIADGLAHAIVVPPNGIDAIECLAASERRARDQRLGIWAIDRFSGEPSARLTPPLDGFRLVEGRVLRVGQSRRSLWLNLDGGFAVRIARKDLIYFSQPAPAALHQRQIRVRGWVRRHDGRVGMQLRHPAMLELVD